MGAVLTRPRRVLAGCGSALAALAAALAVAPAGDAGPTTRWTALRDATAARTEVAAARLGDAIYVAGGFAAPDGATSAVVERYDLRRDRWTRVRDMPVAVNHAAATVHGGHLYVIGGYASPQGLNAATRAVQRYDPRRDRWTRAPDLPRAVAAHVAGTIGGRIYVAGGAREGSVLRSLYVFDVQDDRWSTGRAMRTPREHLAGAASGGAFYVLSGRAAGQGNFAVAERYVPARRRWERVPPSRKPRGGIGAATLADGRIALVGGEEGAGTIREVELYDPRTRRWSRLPGLRTPRHGLGVVARGRDVYAVEGGAEPGLFYSRALERLTVRPRGD